MKRSSTLVILAVMVLAQLALAQVPATISYQGVLRSGGEIVADGPYTLRFKLYDVETLGTPLGTPEWSEDHTTNVTDGLFSVVLGSISAFSGSAIHFNAPYWLEISIVDGATVTTLSPRIELTSAPYAVKSGGVRGSNITFHPGSGGSLGIGTTSPEANLQVLGNWRLGPSASGTPPDGVDNWLNANNGILYEGGGTGWTHHFSAYGGGDIARFGTSTGAGLEPDTRVVITNSGSVGIGTTSPGATLNVIGPDDSNILLLERTGVVGGGLRFSYSSTSNGHVISSGQGGIRLEALGSNRLRFYTASSERVVIDGSGNVGIGTASPAARLTVKSLGTDTTPVEIYASDGSLLLNVYESGSGNGWIQLRENAGAEKVRLHTSGYSFFTGGNVGIGTPTPSAKLEVVGGIKADSILLATAAERWYAIPAPEFRHASNNTQYDSPYYVYTYTAGGFWAPVHLPHGATITGFEVTITDDDSVDASIFLYSVFQGDQSASQIVELSTLGYTATNTHSDLTLSQQVDNQNNTYTVQVYYTAPKNGWDIRIHNARIRYTVNQPLP